jgi:5-formyltetrahydrofolate cyclo-ligase
MIASKQEWRTQMRQASVLWLQKPAPERSTALRSLEKNLHQLLQGAHGTWGAYSALVEEPAIDVFNFDGPLRSLASLIWAFPKVEGSDHLRYLIPKTKDSFLQDSALGVREPDPMASREVAREEIAGVLIPALAFDRNGIRLGRGKGYYDKWLSGFRGTKVGVAFSWQIASSDLPREGFDIPMDIVVTEQGTFRREKK